jgi:two-component system chemotaxis response regulator CheB
VVLHVPPGSGSALPHILDRAGPLPVRQAAGDQPLTPGTVLVAPPDQHLVVYDDATTVTRGPRENGHRPAVDVLFRSAASVLGGRVVSVVLSGALDDGAAGTVAVKLRGGVAVVQDPEEALHASMPRAAMEAAEVDHVLPVRKIAGLLTDLMTSEAPVDPPVTQPMRKEAAMAALDVEAPTDPERPGRPSGFTCPDCNGTLYEIHEGDMLRFRCRVGHAWSPNGLVASQSEALENALWVALRTLEERAALTVELSRRAEERGHRLSSSQFEKQSEEALSSARLLRELIARIGETAAGFPMAGGRGGE